MKILKRAKEQSGQYQKNKIIMLLNKSIILSLLFFIVSCKGEQKKYDMVYEIADNWNIKSLSALSDCSNSSVKYFIRENIYSTMNARRDIISISFKILKKTKFNKIHIYEHNKQVLSYMNYVINIDNTDIVINITYSGWSNKEFLNYKVYNQNNLIGEPYRPMDINYYCKCINENEYNNNFEDVGYFSSVTLKLENEDKIKLIKFNQGLNK